MVSIPGGTFTMGALDGEEKSDEEGSRHPVILQPFFMGKYLVTQEQWREIASLAKVERDLDPNPSFFEGDLRPVERVTWYDAVEFCQRLSRETSKAYRLPSEAEWEYACRAGTTTAFYFGETLTPKLARWRDANLGMAIVTKVVKFFPGEISIDSFGETAPVGSYFPNSFGLYDMHGNVWEWCADPWHESYQDAPGDSRVWETQKNNENDYRLVRGGSWYNDPWVCRSAHRNWVQRDVQGTYLGFRVMFSLAKTS